MKVAALIPVATTLVLSCAAGCKAAPPVKKSAPGSKQAKSCSSTNCSAALNSYADRVRSKIGKNWNFPSGNNNVSIKVDLAQDGSVSNLNFSSSPKNAEAEQKAAEAFNSAQPFEALPSGCPAATMTCIFDSRADQWNSKANVSIKLDPRSASQDAGETKKPEAEESK